MQTRDTQYDFWCDALTGLEKPILPENVRRIFWFWYKNIVIYLKKDCIKKSNSVSKKGKLILYENRGDAIHFNEIPHVIITIQRHDWLTIKER